jgi:hypothetical protein
MYKLNIYLPWFNQRINSIGPKMWEQNEQSDKIR